MWRLVISSKQYLPGILQQNNPSPYVLNQLFDMKLLSEGQMLLQQDQFLKVPLNPLFELQWPHPAQLWIENTPITPQHSASNKLSRILKGSSITGCVSADHPNALFQSILNCLLSLIYTNPKSESSLALLSSLKCTLYSEDIDLLQIQQAGAKIHNLHTKALIARFFARCSHSSTDTCKDLANWAVKNNPLLRTSFSVFFRALLVRLEISKAKRFTCYLNPQECAANIFQFFDLQHREHPDLIVFEKDKQFWLSGQQKFLNGYYQSESISISLIIENHPQEHLTKVKSNLQDLLKNKSNQLNQDQPLPQMSPPPNENEFLSMLAKQLNHHFETEEETSHLEENNPQNKHCACFQTKMTKNKLSKVFELSYKPTEQPKQTQQHQLFFSPRVIEHKGNCQPTKIQFDRTRVENRIISSDQVNTFKKNRIPQNPKTALLKPPQLNPTLLYSPNERLIQQQSRPKVYTMAQVGKQVTSNSIEFSNWSPRSNLQGMQLTYGNGVTHVDTFGIPKIIREDTSRNLTSSAQP